VSVLAAAGAQAQDYPSRPIALVLPFAAGSGIDPTARIVGDELGRALRAAGRRRLPGANGAIKASAVARAALDGYTLFMTTVSTHSANPNLLKSIPMTRSRISPRWRGSARCRSCWSSTPGSRQPRWRRSSPM
jgi:tripartite-type tricarboxylate transporter receptor subunit TctC